MIIYVSTVSFTTTNMPVWCVDYQWHDPDGVRMFSILWNHQVQRKFSYPW